VKSVLVTGTGGTRGAEVAQSLLDGGYRRIGVCRRVTQLDSLTSNPDYHHWCFDLSSLVQIPELISSIVAEYGYLYGLFNNSAIGLDSLLATMHPKDIQALMLLNPNAPIQLAKHAVRGMLVAKTGRIVNITSAVAQTGYKGLSVYSGTKAGLEGFPKSLAREVGKRGITVNNVAPGFMPNDMTAGLGTEQMDQIRRRTPLGRLVTVTKDANGVTFLVSDEGSGITGHTLTIDGGASC